MEQNNWKPTNQSGYIDQYSNIAAPALQSQLANGKLIVCVVSEDLVKRNGHNHRLRVRVDCCPVDGACRQGPVSEIFVLVLASTIWYLDLNVILHKDNESKWESASIGSSNGRDGAVATVFVDHSKSSTIDVGLEMSRASAPK
jgi:hypothetical protein